MYLQQWLRDLMDGNMGGVSWFPPERGTKVPPIERAIMDYRIAIALIQGEDAHKMTALRNMIKRHNLESWALNLGFDVTLKTRFDPNTWVSLVNELRLKVVEDCILSKKVSPKDIPGTDIYKMRAMSSLVARYNVYTYMNRYAKIDFSRDPVYEENLWPKIVRVFRRKIKS